MTVVRIVVGVLLLAHGLVHLLYLAADVDAFSVESGRLPDPARRPVASVLSMATVLAFTLVSLSTWGVPGLSSMWPALTVIASGISMVLLVVYWDRQLVFGLAIDIALVAVALWQPVWLQNILQQNS